MKKLLIVLLATLCLTGCAKAEANSSVYLVPGHCYAPDEIITEDGNIWGYSHNICADEPVPVYVIFDDASTPDYIYDDQIVGIVPDDIARANE